jgi:F0F1-type ATP synthase alpha subunit
MLQSIKNNTTSFYDSFTAEIEETEDQQEDIINETNTAGEVISVKDGVAFVTNLWNIKVGELVHFIDRDYMVWR